MSSFIQLLIWEIVEAVNMFSFCFPELFFVDLYTSWG